MKRGIKEEQEKRGKIKKEREENHAAVRLLAADEVQREEGDDDGYGFSSGEARVPKEGGHHRHQVLRLRLPRLRHQEARRQALQGSILDFARTRLIHFDLFVLVYAMLLMCLYKCLTQDQNFACQTTKFDIPCQIDHNTRYPVDLSFHHEI